MVCSANSTLHQSAVPRVTCDQRTRDHFGKKRGEGKKTKEILRCLTRVIAREVFAIITNPPQQRIIERCGRNAYDNSVCCKSMPPPGSASTPRRSHSPNADRFATPSSLPPTKTGSTGWLDTIGASVPSFCVPLHLPHLVYRRNYLHGHGALLGMRIDQFASSHCRKQIGLRRLRNGVVCPDTSQVLRRHNSWILHDRGVATTGSIRRPSRGQSGG